MIKAWPSEGFSKLDPHEEFGSLTYHHSPNKMSCFCHVYLISFSPLGHPEDCQILGKCSPVELS